MAELCHPRGKGVPSRIPAFRSGRPAPLTWVRPSWKGFRHRGLAGRWRCPADSLPGSIYCQGQACLGDPGRRRHRALLDTGKSATLCSKSGTIHSAMLPPQARSALFYVFYVLYPPASSTVLARRTQTLPSVPPTPCGALQRQLPGHQCPAPTRQATCKAETQEADAPRPQALNVV